MDNESVIRLGVFFGILILMMAWELVSPRRADQKRTQRWPANLLIVVLDTVLVRILLPGATIAVALVAEQHTVGLFHLIPIPTWLAFVLAVLILDMAIYWQHRIFHRIPLFWRIHRMHHTDVAYDVTTALRFHPIEILLSVLIKLVIILLLGAGAGAVMVFEILLNGTAMFNHGNVRLPLWLDKSLRILLVTPDMHRVHHSVLPNEHHQNFGFCLSVWDRWFGSYVAQPSQGHTQMQIGLSTFRERRESQLLALLSQPFR